MLLTKSPIAGGSSEKNHLVFSTLLKQKKSLVTANSRASRETHDAPECKPASTGVPSAITNRDGICRVLLCFASGLSSSTVAALDNKSSSKN